MLLLLLRWIRGYIDFRVQGPFPERFINAAGVRRLNVWNWRGGKENISGCVTWADCSRAEKAARQLHQEWIVCGEHGFPALCRRYRSRLGLLGGLISGTVLLVVLSGRIWNIRLDVPPQINEYEIRQELAEMGYSPGCVYEEEPFAALEEDMCLQDPRISWICINVFGTNSFVTLTPVLSPKESLDPLMGACNLISRADGTVTQTRVAEGDLQVYPGEGIRKGQLLVSGVRVFDNGQNKIVRSSGKIFAKTARKVVFTLPKSIRITGKGDFIGEKQQVELFGLVIPLRLQGEPEEDTLCFEDRQTLTLFGGDLPIILHTRRFWQRNQQVMTLKEHTAKEWLSQRKAWYETGLHTEKEVTILQSREEWKEDDDSWRLEVIYQLDENVAVPSEILLKETP